VSTSDLREFVDRNRLSSHSGNDFGFAVAVNSRRTGVRFNLPFILDEIGVLSINCHADCKIEELVGQGKDSSEFRCELRCGAGVLKVFEAVAEFLEDTGEEFAEGFLWTVCE